VPMTRGSGVEEAEGAQQAPRRNVGNPVSRHVTPREIPPRLSASPAAASGRSRRGDNAPP
jgi:hypothetical protein